MAKAYTYTAPDGYFAEAVEDYGLLPNNATYETPEGIAGFIPRWNGSAWEQVENHKGQEGYVNGQPNTIKDYGPLPEGWSDTPSPPTPEEKAAALRVQRDGLIAATDYIMMADYPIEAVARAAWEAYRQALRDVTAQPGFPDAVVWPEKPE